MSESMTSLKHTLVDFIKTMDSRIKDAQETITFCRGKKEAFQTIFDMIEFTDDYQTSNQKANNDG